MPEYTSRPSSAMAPVSTSPTVSGGKIDFGSNGRLCQALITERESEDTIWDHVNALGIRPYSHITDRIEETNDVDAHRILPGTTIDLGCDSIPSGPDAFSPLDAHCEVPPDDPETIVWEDRPACYPPFIRKDVKGPAPLSPPVHRPAPRPPRPDHSAPEGFWEEARHLWNQRPEIGNYARDMTDYCFDATGGAWWSGLPAAACGMVGMIPDSLDLAPGGSMPSREEIVDRASGPARKSIGLDW